MSVSDQRRRSDFVDEETIQGFVGQVEPGDSVRLTVVLWTVALSVALILAASLWWSATH